MSEELEPGWHLDSAVAHTLGQEWAVPNRYRRVGVNWSPERLARYSKPDTDVYDCAALLHAVLWLAKRGVWVVSAPDDDMNAFALAVCRAIVKP